MAVPVLIHRAGSLNLDALCMPGVAPNHASAQGQSRRHSSGQCRHPTIALSELGCLTPELWRERPLKGRAFTVLHAAVIERS